jgi:hypothetical protein
MVAPATASNGFGLLPRARTCDPEWPGARAHIDNGAGLSYGAPLADFFTGRVPGDVHTNTIEGYFSTISEAFMVSTTMYRSNT